MSEEELRAIVGSLAKTLSALGKAQQKTEAAQRKTEAVMASLAEEHKKTEASIRELHKELGGVGRTQGEIAEDLFRRNLKSVLSQRGIQIDKLGYNWRLADAEFDLIGENNTQVFLVEVKSRLQASDIDTFLSRQIPAFRKYFHQYKGRKLMGGLASLAVDEKLEKRVEEAGLFLFTQTEEGGTFIANSKAFSPKIY